MQIIRQRLFEADLLFFNIVLKNYFVYAKKKGYTMKTEKLY